MSLNPYPLLRPLLFRLDPERAHTLALALLKTGLGPKARGVDDAVLRSTVCGLDFLNPVGLAPGFDKQAEVIGQALDFGFGFVEIGGVTPLPQPGNAKPRLFRAEGAHAVINRFGFNSEGADACLPRFKDWRAQTKSRGIVGVNLAKNKESIDAGADYIATLRKLAPFVDYATVNVSSPNTPGLRDLQGKAQLAEVLRRVIEARNDLAKKPILFVKIAPDMDEAQTADVAEAVLTSGIDGMIVSNTTLSRGAFLPADFAAQAGGLSGKPLFEMSTRLLANMHRLTQGKIPLVGVGGISSGADAYAKIKAGASLVQLYSALVFEGPYLVPRIKRELAELLKHDGFKSVADAVGSDNR